MLKFLVAFFISGHVNLDSDTEYFYFNIFGAFVTLEFSNNDFSSLVITK
jgi:hypothetical protein